MNHNSRHKAVGQNVSIRQRLVEQLNTRQSKAYKPDETGKYYLQVNDKTQILVSVGCDEQEMINRFNEKHL